MKGPQRCHSKRFTLLVLLERARRNTRTTRRSSGKEKVVTAVTALSTQQRHARSSHGPPQGTAREHDCVLRQPLIQSHSVGFGRFVVMMIPSKQSLLPWSPLVPNSTKRIPCDVTNTNEPQEEKMCGGRKQRHKKEGTFPSEGEPFTGGREKRPLVEGFYPYPYCFNTKQKIHPTTV